MLQLLFAFLLALCGTAFAQAPELDASLNETVVMVRKPTVLPIELETTLFKPDGPGPFPIVVINHGKALGDPRFQPRYRPLHAARYFLQRGYAVVVPMRQGFSRSGGFYIGVQCNVESNGRVQADDVKAVLDHLATQSWADMGRIVVMGQSHGGWTTLAFGVRNHPGVKGLVNFAGGLRNESCTNWKGALAGAASAYGRETLLPSLWFYGDNDSFFDADTYRPMHANYVAAGAQARLVAFGTFGSDAHAMFASRAGTPIWQPELTRFLAQIGLPHAVQEAYARYGRGEGATLPPPPSDFAELEDSSRLPYVRDGGRAGYKAFLARPVPRAFALGANGSWGWADGGADPLQRALDNCNRTGRGECRLYAVDDFVVWKEIP